MLCKRSKNILLMLVLITIFALFSTKVIAKNNQNSLFYEGLDYTVKIMFDSAAGISEDATLKVTEFCEGSKEFQQLLSKTDKYISQQGNISITDACFFDVSIIDDGKEIEPEQAVEVILNYKNGVIKDKEEYIKVIHFVEDGSKELLDVTEEKKKGNLVTKISFEQKSFSVIGMIIFDNVDSEIKAGNSEIISGTDNITVKKVWSDGTEVHENDSVVIALFELLSSGRWGFYNEIILENSNEWTGKFENLDESKSYSIKETKVLSENLDKTATYKSEINNHIVKRWCLLPDNEMKNNENIIIVFGESKKYLLRKSSVYDQLNLRLTSISIKNDNLIGTYCATKLGNHDLWKCIWDETSESWNLYSIHGDSYLTLVYDEDQDKYLWTTCREKAEGSQLSYRDGTISATIDNVTKYLGNISGNGPYEGVDSESKDITKFQIFTYEITEPVICNIFNTKNETMQEQEIEADITTTKTIDYLGDGKDNPDTEIDNIATDRILKDLYRLNLGIKMQTDQTGLDLLMVIDVSSSMRSQTDAKDENGNPIQRSEALRQALNKFVPSFLEGNKRNRISIVAFEEDSIILQEWTKNAQEILDKINYQVDGEMPLYAGEGTNYESALIRANESLSMCGYSRNAKAMIFLSDGQPTVSLKGNDDIEKGNVTVSLGNATLSDKGIESTLPEGMETIWEERNTEAEIETVDAVLSFKRHHPEIMIGTIAFNTIITDNLKDLATDSKFVIQIQNGSPKDLIDTMKLITNYYPSGIVITDELSENVELYQERPDFKITITDEENKETILYLSDTGLSEIGKEVLDNECPLEIMDKKIKVSFKEGCIVKNNAIYKLSFNINVSQKAFQKYADAKGIYSDRGDKNTDVEGNTTSSEKKGFYSNGEDTRVTYYLNGAENERKYRKPVVQTREGYLLIQKANQNGENIADKAVFELYRIADKDEECIVKLEGYEGNYVKVNEGETDENGRIKFTHLRLLPFDEGYPYYLVEKIAPEGFEKIEKPIKIYLYENSVKTDEKNNLVDVKDKTVIVKNAEKVEFSFTKVASHDYEKKLSGAEFELHVLICGNNSHSHSDDCWKYIEKQISNPKVTFSKIFSGNTYKLIEVKAPDGYICSSGFWVIEVDNSKNIKIKEEISLPELKKLDNGEYVLENSKEMTIPVTGGNGIGFVLVIGIILITGGIIMCNKKKLSSILMLCLSFVLAFQLLGTTAFAIEREDRGTITVNGVEKGVSVQTYRLMDIIYDYDVQQPKNPMYQWVEEVAAWMSDKYPEYIDQSNNNAVQKKFSTDDMGKIAEVYDNLAVAIKNGVVLLENETVTAEGKTVSVENLIMGNYFILIEGGAKVYRPLSANVVPEWKNDRWDMKQPIVEAKFSEPTIKKTLSDGLKGDHADIGDKVSYELNAVIPSYPQNALAKKYVVSDKLSEGLTLVKSSIQVYGINNNESTLLQNSYVEIAERPVEDKTVSFALDFKYDIISKYESLKITYDAILNENVNVGEAGNRNHAFLDYNNNPYISTSWKSDEDESVVYTYGMKINKVDENEEDGLAGAEFTLAKNNKEIEFAGENGNYHVATDEEESTTVLKTNDQGKLVISGLDADTYVLTEVKAPVGYVKLQNPINITITDHDIDGKPESGDVECQDGFVPVIVKNDKGFTLPVTGGIGTMIFDITGIMLIGAGLLCMIRFSNKNKKSR